MADTSSEPKDQEEQLSPSEPKLDAAGPSNLAKFSNFKDAGVIASTRKTTTIEARRMSDLTIVRKRRQADAVNAPSKEKSKEQENPEEQQETTETPEQQNAPQEQVEPLEQTPEQAPVVPEGYVAPQAEEQKIREEKPEEGSEEESEDEDVDALMDEALAEDQARTKQKQNVAKDVTRIAAIKAAEEAEILAGKEFVSFIWSTVLESLGIGLLWAIPVFDIYIVIGLFSKRPFYHQLPKWQIIGILILNLMVLFFILMLISLVFKTICTGIIAGTFRKVGSLFSDSINNMDEVCKQVKPLIENLPDLGI